jgi:hypothetical protein
MLHFYMLDDFKSPVPCADYIAWAKWMSLETGRVAFDSFESTGERYDVSTVFLGLDHSHFGDRAPVLFESMVFGSEDYEVMMRYCTWQEAEIGHARICRAVSQQLTLAKQTNLGIIRTVVREMMD